MKKAVLLVSFGTSYAEARENSLESIYQELSAAGGAIPVYQAYTSGVIIRKLAGRQIQIDTVEEAVRKVLDHQVQCLYVVPTHMIPGIEYQKLVRILEPYRSSFEKMEITSAVLNQKEDCKKLVPVLQDIFQFQRENYYVLMGHGTEDGANIRYTQMNEAFIEAGLMNVQIASVEARPNLADAISYLQNAGKVDKVVVHPFMVVAGDHARNDMAGETDSYAAKLREEGYEVLAIVKGLGEYPQFRRIYVEKLQEMLGKCNNEAESQIVAGKTDE